MPWCNSNYPLEDGDSSPVRRRAEMKGDTASESRGRQSGEGAKKEREKASAKKKKTAKGTSNKDNNVLVKC